MSRLDKCPLNTFNAFMKNSVCFLQNFITIINSDAGGWSLFRPSSILFLRNFRKIVMFSNIKIFVFFLWGLFKAILVRNSRNRSEYPPASVSDTLLRQYFTPQPWKLSSFHPKMVFSFIGTESEKIWIQA